MPCNPKCMGYPMVDLILKFEILFDLCYINRYIYLMFFMSHLINQVLMAC